MDPQNTTTTNAEGNRPWIQIWTMRTQNQDALHQLPRHQQTTVFRFRTGYCRLNSHLKRIGIKTSSMPLWRGWSYTRTVPAILPASKAADMAHLCVPQKQTLGVCRGLVPDIQISGIHRREELVNATITSNAGEDEGQWDRDTNYELDTFSLSGAWR